MRDVLHVTVTAAAAVLGWAHLEQPATRLWSEGHG